MYADLLKQLRPFDQEHLLQFWDELTDSEQQVLAEQIRGIDFSLIEQLVRQKTEFLDVEPFAKRGQAPPNYQLGSLSKPSGPSEKKNIFKLTAIEAGLTALANGQYAVLVVAGGQGSRLGYPHPKGTFPIGPVNGTSLFQIHCEKILSRSRESGRNIPFCVMTSPATDLEVRHFLDANNWFGISPENRFVFCQGTMPAVDAQSGKVLLAEKDRIELSPNGHGGMLAALAGDSPSWEKPALENPSSSVLQQLQQRGIRHLFYFQVDNALVDICSPEFLGYHLLSNSEMTSQVVRKQQPDDRVGNVIQLDGRLHVIEYSDIPRELSERRTPDGSLEFWAGSIAVHQFTLDFLQKSAPIASALPYHISAKKKVPYINTETTNIDCPVGQKVMPQEPNALKFERFIFDLLPRAENAIVVEVAPRENYAPLKNAPGSAEYSPEWVKQQLNDYYTNWLKNVGATVSPGITVEISPLFANSEEQLRARIEPGTVFDQSIYLYCKREQNECSGPGTPPSRLH